MSWLLVLIIAIGLIVVVLTKQKPNLHSQDRIDLGEADGFPYVKNSSLFSAAERSFLGVLEQAVGAEYRVFGKIRIADVASVKNMSNRSLWQRAFNRISAKHFDFVICNTHDLAIVCVVELDDSTHQQGKRQDRDDFVSGVCNAISLPLLQIPAQHAYSLQELRSKVSHAIEHAVGA